MRRVLRLVQSQTSSLMSFKMNAANRLVQTPSSAKAARPVLCRGKGSRALAELFSLKNEEAEERRKPLKPAIVQPAQPVPDHITKPPWYHGEPVSYDNLPREVHGPEGIEKMRASGKLASEVLAMAGAMIRPGVTTEEIDRAVHEMTVAAGAYPSPLRYGDPPFPKSVCTSVNECICHGIPDMRPLQDGDIVNVDVTVWLNGYHGDTSRTFYVGTPSPAARKLVEATKASLDAAIAVCRPGVDFREIGKTISRSAKASGFNTVRDFIGHGVGERFHALPHVFHFQNNENQGKMEVGQTFTIEPMLSAGSIRSKFWKDGWTAVTKDGSLTAQFEHTLLITETGVEILTAYE